MATSASRTMLSTNAKYLPFHLLCARLSGATTATNIPTFISSAEAQHQGSNLVKFLVGIQATVVSAADIEGINKIYPIFGGFGEMGCAEARRKKVVIDDDSDGTEDDCDDMSDDGDFNDDAIDDDDDGDWDDEDDDDKE